jgi:hypothetical protein
MAESWQDLPDCGARAWDLGWEARAGLEVGGCEARSKEMGWLLFSFWFLAVRWRACLRSVVRCETVLLLVAVSTGRQPQRLPGFRNFSKGAICCGGTWVLALSDWTTFFLERKSY